MRKAAGSISPLLLCLTIACSACGSETAKAGTESLTETVTEAENSSAADNSAASENSSAAEDGSAAENSSAAEDSAMGQPEAEKTYLRSSTVEDVVNDPYFEDFGRLLFPVDRSVPKDMTLEEISSVYVWYNYIDPDKTVEIVQSLHDRAAAGEQVFYDIYTQEEKDADPSKEDTGLFFFRGDPDEKFAVVNAGGGSAGARMAATLGNGDALSWFGREDIPQASAVIMQYTGYTDVSEKDAPTYACVGTGDGIAGWRTMQSRLQSLEALGIPTEFHAYEGLPHGFGIGTGTIAEGWLDDAAAFWEAQCE